MTADNALLDAWEAGKTTFGSWIGIPSSVSAEIVASQGYDYACIDIQHGVVDYTDAVPMMQAIEGQGVAPVVRVPANDAWAIMKYLDAGARAVVIPGSTMRMRLLPRFPRSSIRLAGHAASAPCVLAP